MLAPTIQDVLGAHLGRLIKTVFVEQLGVLNTLALFYLVVHNCILNSPGPILGCLVIYGYKWLNQKRV